MNVLRRLMLLLVPLLLTLGGLPVPSALAAGPASAHAMHGMPDHAPARVPDHHSSDLCLGCVAPVTLGAPLLASPLRVAASPTALPLPALAAPMALPPATPPPRLG